MGPFMRAIRVSTLLGQGDVRKNQDCERWVEEACAKLGGLDILVNCAAGNFLVRLCLGRCNAQGSWGERFRLCSEGTRNTSTSRSVSRPAHAQPILGKKTTRG